AFRNPEMPAIVPGQHRGGPLTEGWRAATDVDGDVVNLAVEHADQLALRIRPLVVQAAQHAARRGTDVGLQHLEIEPGVGEALAIPAFEELPARVTEHLRLDDHATRKLRLDDLHQGASSRVSRLSRY